MCGSAVGSFKEDLDGELTGEVGDFVEVAVLGVEVLAVEAGRCVFAGAGFGRVVWIDVAEGGEERFPHALGE